MKIMACIVAFYLLALFPAQGTLAQAEQKPEDAALKAAIKWLALVDAGKYAESWDEAAQFFKGAVAKEQWKGSVDGVRRPVGKLVSRSVKSQQYTRSLPGAPDGDYVVIQYTTSFANKKSAVETVTPMLDKDGKWRVSGYYIQ